MRMRCLHCTPMGDRLVIGVGERHTKMKYFGLPLILSVELKSQ